jgi:hypothetical protein
MAIDPYTLGTTSIGYFSLSSGSTEPDLRSEFNSFLAGGWPEISKQQKGLLRTFRRDSNNKLIVCPCVDNLTHEPDKDIFCPICNGSGYYWDETYIYFYRTLEQGDPKNALKDQQESPGLISGKVVVFYVRYDAVITEADRIIEIELDTAGEPETPLKRKVIYRIGRHWEYRSDNGRIEYHKVFAFKENVKYLNAPSSGLI